MPDSGVFNYGRIVILYLTIVLWLSENFSFTKLRKNFYVSIISVMTHHNDVSTNRFRCGRVPLEYFSDEKAFLHRKNHKTGLKDTKIPKACELNLSLVLTLRLFKIRSFLKAYFFNLYFKSKTF